VTDAPSIFTYIACPFFLIYAVTVPQGAYPGQVLHVAIPDGSGRVVAAAVPPGFQPGSTFMVEYSSLSSEPPVAQAQPIDNYPMIDSNDNIPKATAAIDYQSYGTSSIPIVPVAPPPAATQYYQRPPGTGRSNNPRTSTWGESNDCSCRSSGS